MDIIDLITQVSPHLYVEKLTLANECLNPFCYIQFLLSYYTYFLGNSHSFRVPTLSTISHFHQSDIWVHRGVSVFVLVGQRPLTCVQVFVILCYWLICAAKKSMSYCIWFFLPCLSCLERVAANEGSSETGHVPASSPCLSSHWHSASLEV